MKRQKDENRPIRVREKKLPIRNSFNAALRGLGNPELDLYTAVAQINGVERALAEFAARLCYNSTLKMGSSENFIKKVLTSGHLSVIEHPSMAFPVVLMNGSFLADNPNERIRMLSINRFFTVAYGYNCGNMRSWFEYLSRVAYRPEFEFFIPIIPEAFSTEALISEIEVSKISIVNDVYCPSYLGSDMGMHNSHLLSVNLGNLGVSTPGDLNKGKWARYSFLIENVSRALTHQFARHRGASISQESQRYVDSRNAKFITPPNIDAVEAGKMEDFYRQSIQMYEWLREDGLRKEDARYVLPSAIATRLVASFDYRELLHFLRVRCARDAQWEIRRLARTMAWQAFITFPTPDLEQLVKEFEIDGFEY